MKRAESLEEIKAILPEFKDSYMQRPPVIGTGLGAEQTPRGGGKIHI